MFEDIGKLLILGGIILILAGVLFLFSNKIPFLGKLPSDIVIQKGNFRFFLPLVTCILISLGFTILINLLLWILRK